MTKKFSIRDWVYPDGDPVEQYDKRVLETFCNIPPGGQGVKESPQFDVRFCAPPWDFNCIFLGIFQGSDLWLVTPLRDKELVMVLEVSSPTDCDCECVHDSYIDDHPKLLEAQRRALERGLCKVKP